MEPTVSINSRPPHQINSKNRVKPDVWNSQKRYGTTDPWIISENRVPTELEIVNEYWVTADVWNEQCQWIHYRRVISIAKIETWLTQGIVKNAKSRLIHKSTAKTESLVDLEIVNEYWETVDVWNRQRQWIHGRRIKLIAKIESSLTHGILKNAMALLIHKSSAKIESLLNLKSSMNIEWQQTYVIDSVNEFTTDASNR